MPDRQASNGAKRARMDEGVRAIRFRRIRWLLRCRLRPVAMAHTQAHTHTVNQISLAMGQSKRR